VSPTPAIRPGGARRRAISTSDAELVQVEPPGPGRLAPVVRPTHPDVDMVGWASTRREWLRSQLSAHGAVLFRGFAVPGVDAFERFVAAICDGELLDYRYRSTPRTRVSGRVYTSTEYPSSQAIPLHNENSYARDWPMKLLFHAATVAPVGGETPIADSRRVLLRIDPEVRERFERHGVQYVRHYRPGLDLPWQTVFQTDDPAAVESFCRQQGIDVSWHDDASLTTRQVCQATARHPATGEDVWFNQAHLFHPSSLPSEVRDALVARVGEHGLPRDARFGDGRPIPVEQLDHVRAAYLAEQTTFGWEAGDVLALDNMLVAHGRTPYEGPRRVLVAMAELSSSSAAAVPTTPPAPP
jgi:alpha-ketoglutarate-dependent taurine dioxygenase